MAHKTGRSPPVENSPSFVIVLISHLDDNASTWPLGVTMFSFNACKVITCLRRRYFPGAELEVVEVTDFTIKTSTPAFFPHYISFPCKLHILCLTIMRQWCICHTLEVLQVTGKPQVLGSSRVCVLVSVDMTAVPWKENRQLEGRSSFLQDCFTESTWLERICRSILSCLSCHWLFICMSCS